MAAQARILLFSWVWTQEAVQQDVLPHGASRWSRRPPRGRTEVAVRPADKGLVGWRLVGANNRELGRSASPAGNVQEAYQAVHVAKATFGEQASGVLPHAGGSWSWHLSLDGDRVAVSSRSYLRQRECGYSLEHFRAVFPTAEVVAPPAHRFRAMRPAIRDVVSLRPAVAGSTEAMT
jgi:hypothetical protein